MGGGKFLTLPREIYKQITKNQKSNIYGTLRQEHHHYFS